jgi:hypothetical protein
LITKERPWKAPTKAVDGMETFSGICSIFIGFVHVFQCDIFTLLKFTLIVYVIMFCCFQNLSQFSGCICIHIVIWFAYNQIDDLHIVEFEMLHLQAPQYIANKSLEDPCYAYLHCELLDRRAMTIVTLRMKSLHIEMHEHLLQKGVYVRVQNIGIGSKFNRGFEKVDLCLLTW